MVATALGERTRRISRRTDRKLTHSCSVRVSTEAKRWSTSTLRSRAQWNCSSSSAVPRPSARTAHTAYCFSGLCSDSLRFGNDDTTSSVASPSKPVNLYVTAMGMHSAASSMSTTTFPSSSNCQFPTSSCASSSSPSASSESATGVEGSARPASTASRTLPESTDRG